MPPATYAKIIPSKGCIIMQTTSQPIRSAWLTLCRIKSAVTCRYFSLLRFITHQWVNKQQMCACVYAYGHARACICMGWLRWHGKLSRDRVEVLKNRNIATDTQGTVVFSLQTCLSNTSKRLKTLSPGVAEAGFKLSSETSHCAQTVLYYDTCCEKLRFIALTVNFDQL